MNPWSKIFVFFCLGLFVLVSLTLDLRRWTLDQISAWALGYSPITAVAVGEGDVVIWDSSTAYQVTTTTTQGSQLVAGVCDEAASLGQPAPITSSGPCVKVAVTGSVSIGDYLITSTTAGKAVASATLVNGVFGRAITEDGTPSAGFCYADVDVGLQDGAGTPSAGTITESMLDITNAAVDEYTLTYETTDDDLEWHAPSEWISVDDPLVWRGGFLLDILADGINDLHIDWGTDADQVSQDDVVDGTSYERVAANQLSSGIYIDATTAVKGIASFVSSFFSVSSGAVSIANDAITEALLKAVNAASDEYCFTYESTTGDFEWEAPSDLFTAGASLDWAGGFVLEVAADGVNDLHVDWGTGTNQVSAADVPFADGDSNYTATTVEAAFAELDDTNPSGVNAADAKVDWTQLGSVPAGFADGTDDTGGGGDITDVFDCATGDCASIAMTDGDLLNASAVNGSSTTEGIIIPQSTDCSAATAEGQLCWDTDNTTLYIGNDGGTSQIGAAGGAGDISDVYNCASGDCAAIAMADGDLLNGSAVNCSGTGEGIILPQAADCAAATAEGQICWDTDDRLYVGTGAATVGMLKATDTGGAIDFGGSTSLEIPNGTDPQPNATGEIALDTDLADWSIDRALIVYALDATNQMYAIAVHEDEFASLADDFIVKYDAATDEFKLEEDTGGSGGFVDRGDPAADDYTQATLTSDGTYYDLDLSAIVPAGASRFTIVRREMNTAHGLDLQLPVKSRQSLSMRAAIVLSISQQV